MSAITAADMDAKIEASLDGWYRAYVHIVQIAPSEAYMRIPRVVVYDSEKKAFIQRRFAGFKGAGDSGFFPVFASLQQPTYSMPPEFDAGGERIPVDIEWSDAEWRNGDRLVEILCGPKWGDVASECEETVICDSSAKLWDWNICIDKEMRKHSARVRDHHLKCASHGLIESLSDLSPHRGFSDNAEHDQHSAYRLVKVGPPLLCSVEDCQAYVSHLSLCSDGTYEPVLTDDGEQSKIRLGMFAERDGKLLVSDNFDASTGYQLNKKVILKPPASGAFYCENANMKRKAHAKWNSLIARGDLIEVTAESVRLLIQEPMRNLPPFLQVDRSSLHRSSTYSKCSIEESTSSRLLVRIPIAHYKSGRSVVQWKKAVDSNGVPIELDPSRAHGSSKTGRSAHEEGRCFWSSEESINSDFTGYQIVFYLTFYDKDGDWDDTESGTLGDDCFCYTARARTEACNYDDPEALRASDLFLDDPNSRIEKCVNSHGVPYKTAHIEYDMQIHRWVDGVKVEEDAFGSESYVIC